MGSVSHALVADRRNTEGGRRPFWSVMIPTYKPRPDYLETALQSVLQQAPGPDGMQIEVIDDGSPDGPPSELVRQVAGDRITVTSEPRNLGLAGIWNRCIERARGEWIHILHQDDLVRLGFYQALRTGAESCPEIGAAFARFCYLDERGRTQEVGPLEQDHPGVLPGFLRTVVLGERVQCAAIAVKRSTYAAVGGFDSRLTHALDWEMWIRIATRFPVYYEPAVLACWRRHTDAATSTQSQTGENIRDIARAIRIWRAYLPAETAAELPGRALARYAEAGLWFAGWYLEQHNYKACQAQLRAALSCDRSARTLVKASGLGVRAGVRYARACFEKMSRKRRVGGRIAG
jgi:glycosyltransferase involved in cell wall biosynthesis